MFASFIKPDALASSPKFALFFNLFFCPHFTVGTDPGGRRCNFYCGVSCSQKFWLRKNASFFWFGECSLKRVAILMGWSEYVNKNTSHFFRWLCFSYGQATG